jgi:hypothetical protein
MPFCVNPISFAALQSAYFGGSVVVVVVVGVGCGVG